MTQQTGLTGRFAAWHLAAAAAVVFAAWVAFSFHTLTTKVETLQAHLFGTYFPLLTLLVIFGGPAALAAMAWWLKVRREPVPLSSHEALVARAWRSYQAILAATALVAVLLLFVLVSWAGSPGDGGARPEVDAGAPGLASGGVTLIGRTLAGRALVYEKRILFVSQRTQFALVEAEHATSPVTRYLVELPAMEGSVDRTRHVGIAVQNALPEHVINQLTEAGFRVSRPYAVIYYSSASLTWSKKALAVQLVLALVVMVIVAFHQRSAYRRMLLSQSSVG